MLPLLQRLAQVNPVAHSAYIRGLGVELLSNSMETLLDYDPHHRYARSRPIKGTLGRPTEAANDSEGARHLQADPKERAEHVMIVDLVRNDLGRLCTPGSIRVSKMMQAEPFRGLWHGVSTVEGVLAPQHSPGALLQTVFPGGSITGAPKRRAMQIIRSIEEEARGFYTGSICVIWPDGRLSASILIRTLVHDQRGWSLSVGGGIVADSIPQREVAETWHKVGVFREVLEQNPKGQAVASPCSMEGRTLRRPPGRT